MTLGAASLHINSNFCVLNSEVLLHFKGYGFTSTDYMADYSLLADLL